MGDTSTSGGGKSIAVQAPMKSSVPIQTGTRSGGFVRNAKKKVQSTAGEALKHLFQNSSPPSKKSYANAPANPYPKLTRNDLCNCGSGRKYKFCCYYEVKIKPETIKS